MNRIAIASLSLALAAPAFAVDTFVVTRGDQMYRYDGNSVSQITISDTFHSLSSTGLGMIGASNLQDNVGNPPPNFEVWRVNNPAGVPSLTQIGSFVDQRFPTITQVGNTLYGIGEGNIFTIDNALNTTFVTALQDVNSIGGSGYDANSGTFYVTDGMDDSFYTIDLTDGSRGLVGALGFDFRNQGGEWWNGQYWAAFEDVTNNQLVLGTISTSDGSFTTEVILDNDLGDLVSNRTVGLAIIPTPSTLALLGLSGLAVTRRRR